ncbi:MAG: arginase family protein [Deltaproteobacteria bacterium]|nr:arginase family protein [Deltaproteobacteria bacterium]
MQDFNGKKVVFFGCPLDSDERDESVREKLSCMAPGQAGDDPYPFVMDFIRNEVDPRLWEEIGSLDVPEWLRPVPPPTEKGKLTAENFIAFIDNNGCRTFAEMLAEHVVAEVYPHTPCMLAVDHSLTGGVLKQLMGQYRPEDTSLVILDSHTDALPAALVSGAIQYDMETNPQSVYDPSDPFLKNRPGSYNASSFIRHVLESGLITPSNLYIIGISDYPPKRSFRIKDARIKKYVGLYSGLKRQGVTLITKKDLISSPSKVRDILGRIKTPHLYVSIDMDVGAGNALDGVRFRNWQGLNEQQIYGMARLLRDILSKGTDLIGMDLTEFNPRRAGPGPFSDIDRTYRIAANLIRRLCFGLDEKH